MVKKPGTKIVLGIAILLVTGLLFTGVIPVMASGLGAGNCSTAGFGMGRNGGSLADIVSTTLGMSREDLAQERQGGKSLLEIAGEKGISTDQVKAAILEKRQANLNQALQDQKITQEQYDQCIQAMEANIDKNLNRTETGPNGKGAGYGMGGGKGQGQRGSQNGGTCSGQCTGQGLGQR